MILPSDFKEFYVQGELDRVGNGLYLEIGLRRGESFRAVRSRNKVRVDPLRTHGMSQLQPGESFLEMTSDEFFAREAASTLGARGVDVALIDGPHRYEHVAADVLGAAAWVSSDGVVILDVCNPRSASRAAEAPSGRAWNGDVWKAMVLLRRSQPQWEVVTVDADQGVGVVWGFGEPPREITDKHREECRALSFQDLNSDRGLIGQISAPHANGLLGRTPAAARHRIA